MLLLLSLAIWEWIACWQVNFVVRVGYPVGNYCRCKSLAGGFLGDGALGSDAFKSFIFF